MKTYKELTSDKGCPMRCYARDNKATYIITSAYGHDLVNAYKEKYSKQPSAKWYNRHFAFNEANV